MATATTTSYVVQAVILGTDGWDDWTGPIASPIEAEQEFRTLSASYPHYRWRLIKRTVIDEPAISGGRR